MRGRSTSPAYYQQQIRQQSTQAAAQSTTTVEEQADGTVTTITTTRTPVQRVNDTDEPIRLSKFAGGFQPSPDQQPKIESLDWPAPPCLAAMPELRARSRSSSNRRAPSTVQSVHGNASGCDHVDNIENINESDSDDLEHDEEVQQFTNGHLDNRQSHGASSVSSSLARVRAASRPNSKIKYQNNLFDNDYNDYMLRYKSDKDWKKMLDKSLRDKRNQSGESGVQFDSYGDLNEEQNLDDDEIETQIVKEVVKETDELEKIKNESKSSMAAELLGEVKAQQKIITRTLKIDPWKASRSPNAKAEPSVRTRYESPVNASPSRVFNYNRMLPNATSGHNLSVTPTPYLNEDGVAVMMDSTSLRTPPPSLIRNQYVSSSSRVISSSSIPKAGNY